jgi:hypothetical protein
LDQSILCSDVAGGKTFFRLAIYDSRITLGAFRLVRCFAIQSNSCVQ